MLDISKIKEAVEASSETKVVSLEQFGTDCIVKKLTRKDTMEMSKLSDDIVSAMIFVGVVNEDGSRVFENVEQVTSLHDKYVSELFTAVNDFNSENVKSQAKKS